MKKGALPLVSVILAIFSLISVNLVVSEDGMDGLDENQVLYVDPAILEAFNNTSEVSVLVNIYSRNSTKVDEVLSTLQSSEFRLEKKLQSGRGFSGNVTVEGLSLLINNSDIKTIYLNKPLHVVSGNGEQDGIESDAIKNYSASLEKEQKPSSSYDMRELKEIKKVKEENLLLPIATVVFVLLIVVYLFVKFNGKIRWKK